MATAKVIDFSSPVMDAGEQVAWVFGKLPGYRCLAFKDRDTDAMAERFYLPNRTRQMIADIKAAGTNIEVFYCPLPLSTPDRWKGNSQSRWIVWVDIDHRPSHEDRDELERHGFWLINSGTPGNVHAYAKVDRNLTMDEHRAIQLALRDRFRGDNKVSDNDLLRVAGTFNYKNHHTIPEDKRNDKVYPVTIEHRGRHKVSADKLIAWLGVRVGQSISTPAGFGAWKDVEITRRLPGPIKNLQRENADDSGDRSARCMAAVATVLEAGFTRDETHVILDKFDPGIDKYGHRWHKQIDALWLKRMNKIDDKYDIRGAIHDGSAVLVKGNGDDGGVEKWTGEVEFWNSRDILTHIYRYAKANQLPPWGLLGAVMARVATAMPPTVKLPDEGTLNILVGLVGLPSDGKGRSITHARKAVMMDAIVKQVALGTGHGIVHQYKREKAGVLETLATQVMFVSTEIDKMTAHTKGQGSTLDSELRAAWSNEPLGGAYSTEGKRIILEPDTYRLTAVVCVQPERAGSLMGGSAGGTPQRWLWFPAYDEHMEDDRIMWPAVELALPEIDGEIDYAPVMWEDISKDRARRARDRKWAAQNVMSGHDLYNRAKVACILAVMDGRGTCDDEDWHLAGIVMTVSTHERDEILNALKVAGEREAKSRGRLRGVENAAAERVVDETMIRRTRDRIMKMLTADDWTSKSTMRSKMPRLRDFIDEALARLENDGAIETRAVTYNGQHGHKYRLIQA